MSELIRHTVVHNCDYESERFRLEKDVSRSDEWLSLARKIERAAMVSSKRPGRGSSFIIGNTPVKTTEPHPSDPKSDKSDVPNATSDDVGVEPETEQETQARARSWLSIEIRFTSDDRIQIIERDTDQSPSFNYADFGLSDQRNGTPNKAWITLRDLAQNNGILNDPPAGRHWSYVEKRIQELRAHLRRHFGIPDDPILYESRVGYRTKFKICCSPSYAT